MTSPDPAAATTTATADADASGSGSVRRVSLHEHLDGSLRPATLLELARTAAVTVPAVDEDTLRGHLRAAVRGSLERYLSCFALTVAVLQNEEALERVAYEHAAQLHADGCDAGEVRFAPQLHAPGPAASIAAVLAGLERARRDGLCDTALIVSVLRERDPRTARTVAEAAAANPGCVAFDLAGMESGNPPQRQHAALGVAREAGLGITIHAGESEGPHSIDAALDAGATRLGHGVRVWDDISRRGGRAHLGRTAGRVRAEQIHLEVCISSNVDTRTYRDVAAHPVLALHRLGFSVGLSTDNRLMSATTLHREEQLCRDILRAGADELAAMGHAAANARFPGRH